MLTPHRKRSSAVVILSTVLLLAMVKPLAGRLDFSPTILVKAVPERQIPIYTPTPGPDGRIIYIVKPNDTLLGISLITGVSLDQLRGLNNLTSDTIYEGQTLILGLGGPVEVTPTPGPDSYRHPDIAYPFSKTWKRRPMHFAI